MRILITGPDIRKVGALLGRTPKVGLEDGLLRTIEFFRKEL